MCSRALIVPCGYTALRVKSIKEGGLANVEWIRRSRGPITDPTCLTTTCRQYLNQHIEESLRPAANLGYHIGW